MTHEIIKPSRFLFTAGLLMRMQISGEAKRKVSVVRKQRM